MAYWRPAGRLLRSNFMTNLPGYRAELANQVIFRLKRLSGEQWLRAAAILEERRRYFDLAYQLTAHAIEIMVEEDSTESRAVLQARLADIDAELCGADERSKDASSRCLIGRGAVLAVFLRDTRGFNLGAFQELYSPVADVIPIGDVELTVTSALAPHAGDFTTSPHAPVKRDGEHRKRA